MDAGNGTNKAVAQINVTPMIDVLLVLLIIFLLIQPAAQSGLTSQIPQPPKGETTTSPSTVVVEVLPGADGKAVYRINQRPFPREEVVAELKTIFAPRHDRTLFVKGDAALTFQDIAQVVNMGHQAGVQNVALMTPRMTAGH